MWKYPIYRTLETVFSAWICSCIFSIAIGVTVVWLTSRPWQKWPIDWTWLKKGFISGFMFLTASMCFRALHTFDRHMVEDLAGSDFLGVYVVYMSMAMAVLNIMEPAVFSFLYPKLVFARKQKDQVSYLKIMNELFFTSISGSFFVAIFIALIAPKVFDWIGKPIYLQHIHILWLLLVMAFIYAIGMVPHYGLYAHHGDKTIFFAHVTSLLIFLISIRLTESNYPMEATAISLIITFIWLGLYKYWHYQKISMHSLPQYFLNK